MRTTEAEGPVEHAGQKRSRALLREACLLLRLRGVSDQDLLAFVRSYGEHKRSVRCGTCKQCTNMDCGECSNCLDKPKFGGKGVRKRACIQRCCLADPERAFRCEK